MTHYFDTFGSELGAVNIPSQGSSQISDLERRLVGDVGLCTQMPGFPMDIRMSIHRVIARWSVATREPELPECRSESEEDHRNYLQFMADDLHTLFHNLNRRRIPGFSDDPMAPIRYARAAASEFRVALARADVLHREKCPFCQGAVTFGPTTISRPSNGKLYQVETWTHKCPTPGCQSGGDILSTQVLMAAEVELALRMTCDPDLIGWDARWCRKAAGATPADLAARLPAGTVIPAGEEKVGDLVREALTDLLLEARTRNRIPPKETP